MGTYNVTRDGWCDQGKSSTGTITLTNRTTEPKGGNVTVDATSTVD
jgi:hypothetical protein